MNNCDLYGCAYNNDGTCCYDDSDVKVTDQMACYEYDDYTES